jgi:Na+-translocating ferredoxin:NAD+ oxidoreductase RnfC subunit
MPDAPSADTIRARCRAAGLVGCGGGGFPTHLKLARPAATLIANAAECEPLLAKDTFLCQERAEAIIRGLELAARAVGARRRVVAAKPKRRTAQRALAQAAESVEPAVELYELPDAYPVGDEVVLVELLTGRRTPRFGLPGDVGALVLNVETLAALAAAVDDEEPLTEKTICVVGAVDRPLVTRVPLGCPAAHLLETAGWNGDGTVLEGGPAMGVPVDPAAAYVSKTTAGYTVLPPGSPITTHLELDPSLNRRRALSACTQCRYCTDHCPRWLAGQHIRPHRWMRALCLNLGLEALAPEMWACSGCGVCELYACPEGLSPRRAALELRRRYPRPAHSPREPAPREPSTGRRPPTTALLRRLGLSDHQRPVDHVAAPTVGELRLALLQGVGYPARPVVDEGRSVEAGRLLAEPTAALAVPLHAPAAGTVSRISETHLTLEVRR